MAIQFISAADAAQFANGLLSTYDDVFYAGLVGGVFIALFYYLILHSIFLDIGFALSGRFLRYLNTHYPPPYGFESWVKYYRAMRKLRERQSRDSSRLEVDDYGS